MEKYICLVDAYRRPSRRRNTAGRYIVCAKNEKEAKELLQKAIGFGSVQVYYKVQKDSYREEFELKLKNEEMYREEYNTKSKKFDFIPVHHATEHLKK